MSYSIQINGHKEIESEGESRKFEESILAEARKFAASLEGLTSGQATFGTIGIHSLYPGGESSG